MSAGRRGARLAAAVGLGLLLAAEARAVGLGGIEVTSTLNEPFAARIPLSGLRAGELEELRAGLADENAHARAGLERTSALARLRFRARAGSGRSGYLEISGERLREPAFSFIVEVVSAGQVVQRRYDVLVGLPGAAPGR